MGQVATPKSDDSVGTWTPPPLYSHLNGTVPNDGSPVSTSAPGDTFQVSLTGVAWPPSGPEILTVRLAELGGSGVPVTVLLVQGSNLIAVRRITPGAGFANEVFPLTDSEKALISNYKDLHVQVVAGDVVVTCCSAPVRPVLTATFTGALAALGSIRLRYIGNTWFGVQTACGNVGAGLTFGCSGLDFTLGSAGPGTDFVTPPGLRSSCTPFNWSATGMATGICSGSYTVTVTE